MKETANIWKYKVGINVITGIVEMQIGCTAHECTFAAQQAESTEGNPTPGRECF